MHNTDLSPYERDYINKIMSEPILTHEEEIRLARAWQEKKDEKSLQKLISCYSRYGVKIAYDFKGYGLPIFDLIQEAQVGLIEAANRFDVKRDVRFSTYAMWWIKAAIQEHILRNTSIVRIATTATQKSLFFNFKRLRAQRVNEDKTMLIEKDFEELANELHVPIEAVKRMETNLVMSDQQLNNVVGDDHRSEQQDFLVDPNQTPEESTTEKQGQQVREKWVSHALDFLTPREQEIIKNRFMQEKKLTLSEIGAAFGVTKERIRQIENKALEKLKTALSQALQNPYELLEV